MIVNLGDVNPLDYGGYFILDPETAELLEVEDDSAMYTVYRFALDRCKMKRGFLVPFAYENDWPYPVSVYEEWFARDLSDVANFIGSDEETLQNQFCSEDAIVRAHAYRAIGEYHGFANLDGDPLRLTRKEAAKRYES